MEFRKALMGALKICGEKASDPILMYCALCDMAGNDLLLKPQLEMFHCFNKTFNLVEAMAHNPEPRTIGELLEKCKRQPDAPVKLCLKWIHTLFEFYYRAKNINNSETEQILKSVDEDFFEPEQEGMILPKPKKAGQKAPQRKAASPQAPTPPRIKIQPAGQSLSRGSQTLTNVIYKVLPDNACVYKSENERQLHLSTQCPCIRPALNLKLYKATYDRARYKDFVTLNGFTKNTTAYQQMSRNHIPPVCSICGNFTPILYYKPQRIEYRQL